MKSLRSVRAEPIQPGAREEGRGADFERFYCIWLNFTFLYHLSVFFLIAFNC